ncbi:phasin family protein [Lysobacter silvisoli]|uniref:Poly(Hydroxyalcanoate) granule associated protein n=1 Tax=Lysobacter silvisoli TaxID=2293254 RepID=A0A371K389_9GAMM|nr:phasin family protein [Lysobacter silvisoli]RDZ28344.1 poly(hydroxyalcanoate) granule associated protein [Lysobacter silvisoli]
MAKFKKNAKKTASASKTTASASAQEQAERLSKTLSESAQQIWLAGVGAFSRAQAEGTKLFEGLVKEGLSLEQTARKFTGGQADALRDAVESKVGHARERAADTWDRLEKVFEERVQRALVKLGVPGRDDLAGLSQRVDALTAELRRQGGKPAAKAAAKPAAAKAQKVTAAKKVAKQPALKKAAAKAPRKAVAKPKPPVAP